MLTREQLTALMGYIKAVASDAPMAEKYREVELYKAFGFDPGRYPCTTCNGCGTIPPRFREWPRLTRICYKCNGTGWIEYEPR
jgi:DnaJ-class molecular chaperone